MKKFLIRREMEGAGSIPKHDLNNAGKGSKKCWRQCVLKEKT